MVGGLQTSSPGGLHRPVGRLEAFRWPELTRALEDRPSSRRPSCARRSTWCRRPTTAVLHRDASEPEQWYLCVAATLLRDVDMDRVVRRVRPDLGDGPRRDDELIAGLAEGIPRRPGRVAQPSISSACRDPARGSSGGRTATPWPAVAGRAGDRRTGGHRPTSRCADLAKFGPASRGDIASWTGLRHPP